MALPSVHVIQGFAGGDGQVSAQQPLLRNPKWSEEIAANTPSTMRAEDSNGLTPVFRVTNTVDIYFKHGVNVSSAATGPRHLLLAALAPHDIYVSPNDNYIWTTV